MFKNALVFSIIFFSVSTYAKEYAHNLEGIHTTSLQSSWCGNLAVSTKVGKLSESGKCIYLKETDVRGFDTCDPLQLNGAMLEKNAGLAFDCAATHVRSDTTGEGLDEYTLVIDRNGHYVDTIPARGNIKLG